MENDNIGLEKKSFSINYKGGEIWIEHLDSIQNPSLIKEKFIKDLVQIRRPSTSSFIAINLDKSGINAELLNFILDSLCNIDKPIRKVVLVGLNKAMKRLVKWRMYDLTFAVACIDDFEKAKEWLY